MENIKIRIGRTGKLLDEISDNMDRLSFDTFDSIFPVIAKNMKDLQREKKEIVDTFGPEAFLEFAADLVTKAKLIEGKFDNIVEIFTREEKKLQKELFGFAGGKKIANYLRY